MWLFNWFWNAMADLGLYDKHAKLVFLGLDNAGKTTLLNLLASGRVQTFVPTQKPTMEEFKCGGLLFRTYDLGGHETARRIWSEYSADADGIIYVVDASDRPRFDEALVELKGLCEEGTFAHTPILILANKIDLPECPSERELRAIFGVNESDVMGFNTRPMSLHMCSLIRRQGYSEGIQWLSQLIR